MISLFFANPRTCQCGFLYARLSKGVVVKRSVILGTAFVYLLGLGGGPLLAQKGMGKMGSSGMGSMGSSEAGKSSTHSTGANARSVGPAGQMHSAGMSVSTKLANNAALSARIQPLLPAGSTIATASAGFPNQGEFIAALHVAQNVGIPFAQLKADLTQPHPDSLGQAIHALRPDLSRSTVKSDVRTARLQADQDMDAAQLANTLSSNTTLAGRAQALLPAGTNVHTAAAGFEDAHQFVLVEHIAHDLNISFDQLKTDVTGTKPMSLRQAISTLRPDLSSATIATDLATARQETNTDLQAAGISGRETEMAKQ
jgi:hypothetical protein